MNGDDEKDVDENEDDKDDDDEEEEEEEDEDGDHLDPAFLRQHTKVASVDVAKVVDAIAAQVVVAQIILWQSEDIIVVKDKVKSFKPSLRRS